MKVFYDKVGHQRIVSFRGARNAWELELRRIRGSWFFGLNRGFYLETPWLSILLFFRFLKTKKSAAVSALEAEWTRQYALQHRGVADGCGS